jgi:adenosine deaminase CECR1
VVGFDAVGYEDEGYALQYFSEDLWQFHQQIPFVLHAGETLMAGSKADQNLYDAILLQTRRIGHGLSLIHHPYLQQLVRQRSIAIELCPLSNRVLKYVPSDLRLHPIGSFLANGLPVVLAPDDPAIFGLCDNPCSHDFWVVWMLWERVVGVATLKQLAMNSIKVILSMKIISHNNESCVQSIPWPVINVNGE